MARARVRTLQNAFTSGELSPELDGRTDQDRYFKGAALIENFKLRPLGGVTRRPGTTHVAAAKATTKRPQLVPFVARASSAAYCLEFGESGGAGYLRFFTRNGQILTDASEKITNGGFPTNLAGWTLGGTTQWSSFNGGCMELLAKFDNGRQSATVLAGIVYAVKFQLFGPPGQFTSVRVGTADGLIDLLNVALLPGSYTYMLTSSTTTMAIRFGNQTGVSAPQQVDNVSIAQSGAAFEIVSPYLAVDLPKLRWAPSADVMYLACEGYAPRKLSRTSDTGWTLSTISFRPPPTEEKPITPAADLTLGAVTGTGITATASVGVFLAADDGRQIKAGAGRAVITGFTSATVVTVDILDDFANLINPNGTWTLNGSPNCTLTPSKKEPKGAQLTLTASAPASAFRAADVGKYVPIQNGLVKITKFTSATVVAGEILHKLDAVTGTTNWTLESESWNATDGYPVDVGFSSGDRLVWGRSDRVWLSVTGDYENYSPSTLDDDEVTLALRTAEVSEVRGIVGATQLQVFTTGAEFVIEGGADSPITPTNFKISSDTTFGSGRLRPLRVGGVTLFVDKSARGLREFVFDIAVNRYVAVDLLQLAQHLFPIGLTIVDLAYQRSPDSVIWAVRSDGVLCGLTYLRAENVVGWHHHVTDGIVESVAVIPHPDGDREQVWLAVQRTINGAVVRYIERLDDASLFSDSAGVTYGQKNTDATLSYSGAATASVTGLGHLEGKTVVVVGDGVVVGTFTVTAGAITLPAAYSNIEVGLPYTSTLVTIRPEVQVSGTSQGVRKRNAIAMARVYRTSALKVNGQAVAFRQPSDPMTAVPLYTGDKFTRNLGWDRDGRLTITQDQPLPCTVLALSSVLGVGV